MDICLRRHRQCMCGGCVTTACVAAVLRPLYMSVTTAVHVCYNRFTCVRLASVANCEGEGVSKEEKQQEHESRRIFILG